MTRIAHKNIDSNYELHDQATQRVLVIDRLDRIWMRQMRLALTQRGMAVTIRPNYTIRSSRIRLNYDLIILSCVTISEDEWTLLSHLRTCAVPIIIFAVDYSRADIARIMKMTSAVIGIYEKGFDSALLVEQINDALDDYDAQRRYRRHPRPIVPEQSP